MWLCNILSLLTTNLSLILGGEWLCIICALWQAKNPNKMKNLACSEQNAFAMHALQGHEQVENTNPEFA